MQNTPEDSPVICEPVTRKLFTDLGKAGQLISDALADEDSPLTEDTLLTIAVALLADEEIAEELKGLSPMGLRSFYSKLAKGKEPEQWEAIEDVFFEHIKNPKYRNPAEVLLTTPDAPSNLPKFPPEARPSKGTQAAKLTRQLFMGLFASNEEISHFLLAHGMQEVVNALPHPSTSKTSYVFSLVRALERRAYISGDLFNKMVAHNPRMAEQVVTSVRLMRLNTPAYT
jgi:hypothetical protein